MSFLELINSLPVFPREMNCYIWGTGNTANLYQNCFCNEKLVIKGYIDNNESKWGKKFHSYQIFSPKVLDELTANDLVLICSTNPLVYISISEQIAKKNVNYCHVDAFIFGLHKKELLEVYDFFYDDESRRIYSDILKCRVFVQNPDESSFCLREKYFALNPFLIEDSKEVFVDVGAYTGESAERYLWTHEGICKRIVSFEPDPLNYKSVKYRFDRLRKEWHFSEEQLTVFKNAVGDKNITNYLCSSNNGLSSLLVDSEDSLSNDTQIETVTIDSFFENEMVSFIKADIESYESNLLIGAQKTIQLYKPKLAICIYHNATDYWHIPILIRQLNPEYKIAIRHHSPTYAETVLYAW